MFADSIDAQPPPELHPFSRLAHTCDKGLEPKCLRSWAAGSRHIFFI